MSTKVVQPTTRRRRPTSVLRRRLITASTLAMALSIAAAMLLTFELVLVNERVSLDRSLRRQHEHLQTDVRLLLDQNPRGTDRPSDIALAVAEFLEREPDNTPLVTMVVTGDLRQVGPSADVDLQTAARNGGLDSLPVGRLRTAHTVAGDARAATAELLDGDRVVGRVVIASSLEPARGEAFAALRRLTLAAGLSLMVGWVIMAVLTRRLLKPLQRLRDTAASADLSRLHERVDVTGDDEVTELAREFNAMLDRLDEASADRERLFATISHELRTPLAVAQGHVELAGKSLDPRDTGTRRALDVAHRELLRAGRMVADLLALGRSGRADFLQPRPTALADIAAELELRVDALDLTTVTVAPPPAASMMLDADRVLQAVMNLVLNAVEHNPPGTTADVTFEVDDQVVVIAVTDDGRGIPMEQRGHVVEPFVRLETDRDSSHSSGLGLSVASAVATSHGGELRLLDANPGTRAELVLALA